MSTANATSFVHQALRTRVIARPGAVAELGRELARLGCKRPLLLSGQRTAAGPVWADVRRALGDLPFLAVQDIEPHSSLTTVERVAQLAHEHGADALVAVGGGSVSDTAKAVALVLAEGAPLAQHASRFVPPTTVLTPDLVKPKLPILSIAMTASGAEATPSLGIRTPDGIKLLFWDAQLASRVIFLDPVANLATPASVMLSTGMNGLAHCIEGLYSKAGSPITSILALDGIVQFNQALRQVAAMPQDVNARANLLLAAHISGMVLASARSCLHHALCHVMGATFGVAHGDVNSAVLPHALRFNAAAAARELAPAAARLGLPGQPAEAGEQLVNWLHELQQAIGVPSRLRDLGVAREQLAGVAQKTMHERGLAYNPRSVNDASELEAILLAAW